MDKILNNDIINIIFMVWNVMHTVFSVNNDANLWYKNNYTNYSNIYFVLRQGNNSFSCYPNLP